MVEGNKLAGGGEAALADDRLTMSQNRRPADSQHGRKTGKLKLQDR